MTRSNTACPKPGLLVNVRSLRLLKKRLGVEAAGVAKVPIVLICSHVLEVSRGTGKSQTKRDGEEANEVD